jgi:hypothetical protein
MPTTLVTIALLGGFVVLIGVIVTRRVIRHRRLAKPVDPEANVERCRCGYPMDQLDLLRCPECGRVRGFDATAEELGLTDDQLRLAKTRADQRKNPN